MKYHKETTLKMLAKMECDTVCSYDSKMKQTMRRPTSDEQKLLFGIIAGALLAANFGSHRESKESQQAIKDCAEFIAGFLLPNCNNYATVYSRIGKIIDVLEEDEEDERI